MDNLLSDWAPLLAILWITLLLVLRLILATRVAERARFLAVQSVDIPPGWQPAFADTDAELRDLGFEHLCWCRTEFAPRETLAPELARFYKHGSEPVVARVLPPQVFAWPDRCGVALFSLESSGTILATADRLPELFPRPPESLAMGIVTVATSLADLLDAHRMILAAREDQLALWGDAEDVIARMNAFEVANIRWLQDAKLVAAHPEGGLVPRLRTALGFIWRSLRGQVVQPRPESEPLKPEHAALLFQQWRKAQRLTPTPWVQWGLFSLTALGFLIAGGILWDWLLTTLLLAAVVFHELGHYLAMRWLGYQNLQIMMLPLLGGLATGVERRPTAANRAFVSLMGPVPGILLGWLLVSLASGSPHQEPMLAMGVVLLILNYLNLLPLAPLDGGQLVKALIPPRWLVLIVIFELLGAGALFWAGIALDPVLALIGLAPLIGAILLWRRRRRLRELQDLWEKAGKPEDELGRIALAIQVEDAHGKRYRPVVKKARALQEMLDTLALKPPAAATRALLLSVYLGLFLVPLAAAPGFGSDWMTLVKAGFQAEPSQLERLQEEAHSLAWAELLDQLSRLQLQTSDPLDRQDAAEGMPEPPARLLRAPASATAIAEAERRLGLTFPPSYRAFLAQSDGLQDPWTTKGEPWLLPVREVATMAERLPEQLATLKESLSESEHEGDDPVILVLPGIDFAAEPKGLVADQLDDMLVIGIGGIYDDFILLTPDLGETPGELGVLQLSQDLMATGYPSFRAFVEAHYAIAKLRSTSPCR
ncbi:SMI1/KNR4 family protein [Thiorhodococcus minor]|uniref:Knr4/Smi1-like domain-containing protein n=1 Tax=Thiorhodococcus minor TaxID=57489 RepID=A0A6M0K8D5_9GAMM|nr:SMI1/KNR4 family protein [Thiorhodococcus minor]NEV64977.1 hypothetical protein [Thiorhodococcus minor]